TYNEVNQILNHNELICQKYSDLVETLNIMKELSSILRKKRMKKGALEFDVSEYKITLNQDGSPKNIIKRTQDAAEKLIEDFMLLANETVAYHMNIMNLPCIYRVHEKPDQKKLMNTISELSSMGISVSTTKKGVTSKNIQDILENLENDSKGLVANQMLLRSMMKAKYSEVCLGHYGLAMHYYCHFTSPIRRYPDLMVHRMIKKLCIHPKNYEEDRNHFEIIAPNIAQSTSKSERNAVECERAVNDMLFAWYMTDKIGLCYEGTITSLTGFGIFVLLDNGVEGMVSLSDLDGYFDYDAVHNCYTDGKVSYSLGQRVEIIVIDSDKISRRIDFMMKRDYRR
ncbi:MAG: RNB domain-containing ribonuclease, partial [Anaeroplasmataceae bacterium]|nr:RNB domain-containing ribonuclease [Anaeroplasmataceae bacterium]